MSSLFSINLGYNSKFELYDRNIFYFVSNVLNSFYLKSKEFSNSYINVSNILLLY